MVSTSNKDNTHTIFHSRPRFISFDLQKCLIVFNKPLAKATHTKTLTLLISFFRME